MANYNLRYVLTFIAIVLFGIGLYFAIFNKKNLYTKYEVVDLKTEEPTPKVEPPKIDKETVKKEKTDIAIPASKSETSYTASEKIILTPTPLILSSGQNTEKKNFQKTSSKDFPTPLHELADKFQSNWGIKVTLDFDKTPEIALNIEKLSPDEAVKELARQLGIPVVGNINALGTIRSVYITNDVLYVGADGRVPDLLKSLSGVDELARHNAYTTLDRMREENLEPYFANLYLTSEDFALKTDSLNYIKITKRPEIIDQFIKNLSDASVERRDRARDALKEIKGDIVMEKLQSELALTENPAIKKYIEDLLNEIDTIQNAPPDNITPEQ